MASASLLQVDIDADLAPAYHPFRLDVWSRHIAAFMSSDFLFVGVPDHSSPVNGGVWLAKPRRWLYAEALALMRNCTFSFAHGFNDVGAPRSLRLDLGALQLGAGGGNYATDLLHRTSMFEHNDWKFTGGSLDQGLLFYLIYLRHNRGTWATSASMAKKRDLWKVSHFWGAFKPWRRSGKARANYLKRLAALPSSNETLTRCVREMRELEAELRREGAWEADDKLGWIPHEMPVLPALTVRERRPPPGRAPHPRYDAPAEEGGGRTATPAPALAARRPQGTSAPRVSGAPRVGVRSGEGVAAQGHEVGHGAAAENAPWLGAAALLLLLCVARVVRSSSHASGSRHLGHTRYAPVSQQVGDGNAGDGSASSERRGSGQTRARK